MLGAGADFVIVPDIVAGGLESLAFSLEWLHRLSGLRLLAVQDGMTPDDVRPYLGVSVGLAVGGTTDAPEGNWKEQTLPAWGALARETGCYLHVLRVNSARRILLCQDAGAHSCDGTSVTRFAKTLPRLDAAAKQQHLFGGN